MRFRKSKKVGPFRLNFSNAGVGVSVGVKGARVGVNAKGTYVQVGRGGIYYRKNFPHKRRLNQNEVGPRVPADGNRDSALQAHLESSIPEELKAQLKRANAISWEAYLIPPIAFIALYQFSVGVVSLLALLSIFPLRAWSRHRRRAVLQYNLDDLGKNTVGALQQIAGHLGQTSRLWYIKHEQAESDWKRNAGASRRIDRAKAEVRQGAMPNVSTNIEVWGVHASNGLQCFFLPDGLYVTRNNAYGVFPYSKLSVTSSHTRFIESERVPDDSEVVDETWQYVNKRGGPDRRFKFNRRLPIVRYGQLFLNTSDGLDLEFYTSSDAIAEDVARALTELSSIQRGLPDKPPLSTTKTPKPVAAQKQGVDAFAAFERNSRDSNKRNNRGNNDGKEKTEMDDSFLSEALEQIGSNVARAEFDGTDGIDNQAFEFADEIKALIDFEPSQVKSRWITSEIERYHTRIKLVTPCYKHLMALLNQKGYVDLDSDPLEPFFESLKTDDSETNRYQYLQRVLYALYALLLQSHFIRLTQTSLQDSDVLDLFNKQYHSVKAKCVMHQVEIPERFYLELPLQSTLENALYEMSDYTQEQFYRKELRRSVAWCTSLMPKYEHYITNGADRMIKSEITDARELLNGVIVDLFELQVLYGSLVDAPYTMLTVIRQHEQDVSLPQTI